MLAGLDRFLRENGDIQHSERQRIRKESQSTKRQGCQAMQAQQRQKTTMSTRPNRTGGGAAMGKGFWVPHA